MYSQEERRAFAHGQEVHLTATGAGRQSTVTTATTARTEGSPAPPQSQLEAPSSSTSSSSSPHAVAAPSPSRLAGEEQGSDAWHALRATRLTASAFSNACGFWRGGRNELWEEKLGLAEPFAGNDATNWGSGKEDEALVGSSHMHTQTHTHRHFLLESKLLTRGEEWLHPRLRMA